MAIQALLSCIGNHQITPMRNDYWSTVVEGNKLYQMGPQSHRIYLLDLLSGNIHNFYEYAPIRSLLDVGCGTAPIYQLLQLDAGKPDKRWSIIEKYKGVDPSPTMIESCKFNFPDGDFAVEDARHLTEPDNSWDCLLYMHAFDYIYEYQQAIKEMHRVTRKYVCIVLWQRLESGDSHRLNNSINGVEPVDWDMARLQHFSWPLLQEEFEQVGFKLLIKKDDEEINKEGRHNTLLLFEKI